MAFVAETLVPLVATLLAVAGALFSLIAAIGLLRLPDLFTRIHAASKAGALGAGLILLAVVLVSEEATTIIRALLALLFLLLSTPVGAHLLAKAAIAAGITPKTGQSGTKTGPDADL